MGHQGPSILVSANAVCVCVCARARVHSRTCREREGERQCKYVPRVCARASACVCVRARMRVCSGSKPQGSQRRIVQGFMSLEPRGHARHRPMMTISLGRSPTTQHIRGRVACRAHRGPLSSRCPLALGSRAQSDALQGPACMPTGGEGRREGGREG